MAENVQLPSVQTLYKKMRYLSLQLYKAWKKELSARLMDLEFEGYIAQKHIDVDPAVWKLPNDELRYALCKLQDDLDDLGYEYSFQFQNIEEVHWTLGYAIEFPERYDEDEIYEDDEDNEDNELLNMENKLNKLNKLNKEEEERRNLDFADLLFDELN